MLEKVNCMNCIHRTACKNTSYDYYGEDAASAYDDDSCCKEFAKTCEDFSDKDEWVHLPCKAGDMAYFVSEGGIHEFTVGTVAVEVSEEGTLYYIVDKDWSWEGYIGDNVFLDKLQAENKYDGIQEDDKPKTKEERKKQWLKEHWIEKTDRLSGQTDVITVLYQEIMN